MGQHRDHAGNRASGNQASQMFLGLALLVGMPTLAIAQSSLPNPVGNPTVNPLATPTANPLAPPVVSPPAPPAVSPTANPTPAPSPTPKPKPKQPLNEFPPNPLELRGPDPLLPQGVPGRPLTEAERQQLIPELDRLNLDAAAQLKSGERSKSFDTWNRELRLRRLTGLVPEVQALGRVGDVGWRQNQAPQVRVITQRLDAILAQIQKPTFATSPEAANRIVLLDAIGFAYEQVRSPGSAASAYELSLADARQRQDGAKVNATLLTLAQLYLNWFNYPKAAATYGELLTTAQSQGDRPNEILYLAQLAYVHEQAKQPQQAIPYQEKLIAIYQQSPATTNKIPAVQIRLADNYQLADQAAAAEKNYQAAYSLAQSVNQLGYAGDALKKLGVLYKANDRLDAALQVYDFLIGVEQQAYNVYGMMSAYDAIGRIHLSRKAYPQAVGAFQQALALAKQIRYREDYFTAQIQKASEGGK